MKDINLIEAEVAAFASEHPNDFVKIFDKIRAYSYADYTEDYIAFDEHMHTIKDIYFQEALANWHRTKEQALKEQIIQLADFWYGRRYDVLIRLEDEEAFGIALQYAEDYLKGGDFIFAQGKYVSDESLLALAEAYEIPMFRDRVHTFLANAFDYAKNYALQTTKPEPEGDTLLAICQSLSRLKNPDRQNFASHVLDMYTFASMQERRHESKQASGYIALLLTLFEYNKEALPVLENVIDMYKKHYSDSMYVQQALYAKWWLSGKAEEAFEYFKNDENKQWLQFSVMALADLGYTEALPLFREKQQQETDPVLWEVYEEAIQRLTNKYVPTRGEDRMVWLSESVSPTQRALGAASKNIFVARASKKVEIDNTLYETDEDGV
jgi:hypothetical protein